MIKKSSRHLIESHLCIYIIALLSSFCKTPNSNLVVDKREQSHPVNQPQTSNFEAITDLKIKQIRFKGNLWPMLEFNRPQHFHFAEYKACPESSTACQTNKIYHDSHILTQLPEGQLKIYVRAVRRDGKNFKKLIYGPYSSLSYYQEHSQSKLSQALYNKTQLSNQIIHLGEAFYEDIFAYNQSLNECSDPKYNKLISTHNLQILLKMTPDAIGLAFLDPSLQLIQQNNGQTELDPTLSEKAQTSSRQQQSRQVFEGNDNDDDGDETEAKITFIAGSVALLTPLVAQVAKRTFADSAKQLADELKIKQSLETKHGTDSSLKGGIKPLDSSDVKVATPDKIDWGNAIKTGAKATAALAVLTYLLKNKDQNILDTAGELVTDVFSLTSGCQSLIHAFTDIKNIEKERRSLLTTMKSIDSNIKRLTP